MLSQGQVDELLKMPKVLTDTATIQFPTPGTALQLEAKSADKRETFLFDVNRKGRINLSKVTFLNRYAVTEILLRLDIGGPTHVNPDGVEVPCPHLHVYREGYADKWAIPLPSSFNDPANFEKTFRQFLQYAKVEDIPKIQMSIL